MAIDLTNKKYQSKEKGDIILSPRTFGIELEVINKSFPNTDFISEEITNVFNLEHDGSIQNEGGIACEFISPVLSGKAGEDCVKNIVDKIRENLFTVNNSCGFHVHLDGADFNKKSTITKRKAKGSELKRLTPNTYSFSEKLYTKLSKIGTDRQIISAFNKRFFSKGIYSRDFPFPVDVSEFSIFPESSASLEAIERNLTYELLLKGRKIKCTFLSHRGIYLLFGEKNLEQEDYICLIDEKNLIPARLKAVMMIYTTFNNMFMSLIPHDRRNKNRFCKSILTRISPFELVKLDTLEQLEKLWFRASNRSELINKKGNKYDESRYYGVNFHSLFAKYNTIEIRWHGGTLNKEVILNWIVLHQCILDQISGSTLADIEYLISRCLNSSENFDPEDLFREFVNIINLPIQIEEFYQHRLDFFNQKKLCVE